MPFDWSGLTVLVTGASGFVGSHLAEKLLTLGAQVRCLLRHRSSDDYGSLRFVPSDRHAQLQILRGDIRDPHAVREAVQGVEVVFHLAALISVPYSCLHPHETVATNVSGTLNVLMAAKDGGSPKVVHMSTSAIYGITHYLPIDEAHPICARSPYAASKIAADKLAESFHLCYGLPVVIVRPFNIYGPRQPTSAVIPAIITQALSAEALHLGNTKPTRDFTYVSDVVSGLIRAAECPQAVGTEINLGSQQEISIEEVAQKVLGIVGRQLPFMVDPERVRDSATEPERQQADTRKAQELLQWRPTVGLEEGLERTIGWFQTVLKTP